MVEKALRKLLKLDFTYLLGLAIFTTISWGLFVNTALSLFGITNPLSTGFVWPIYIFFLFPFIKLLWGFWEMLTEDFSSWVSKALFVLNPIIAVMGVRQLDNTGDSTLAILSVVLVCVNFGLTFLQKNIEESNKKLALYTAGLSLILANCLRSNYLVGWDIHQEFLVFKLTSLHNVWNINAFKDAYNACLSITILPTIIRNLTGIDQLSVYKIVFPLIIALVPVVVYQIGKRMTTNRLAYAGAFAFLLQGQYIGQLPALMRQGIAFLFFGLMVDTLIRIDIDQKNKNFFVLIFGTGLILSHYSTNYITLALLVIAKVVAILFNKLWPCRYESRSIKFWVLGVLFGMTFLWNVIITETATGMWQTVTKTFSNMGNVFSLENKSDFVRSVFYKKTDTTVVINEYWKKGLENTKNPQDFEKYKIEPVSLNMGYPKLAKDPIPLYFNIFIPWIFRLTIIFGLLFLLLEEIKDRVNPTIVSLSVAMLGITALMIVLPFVSVNYNFERLLQQMLFLLAPISAIGIVKAFEKIKILSATPFLIILYVSYLISTTGVLDHFVYQSGNWMFDNIGEQYYRYFSTEGEVQGIKWLKEKTEPGIVLYTDKYSKLRTYAYSDQKFGYISSQLNPPLIEKYGYVFSGLAGTVENAVFADIEGQAVTFRFPTYFLRSTKNNIYSNQVTRIYK